MASGLDAAAAMATDPAVAADLRAAAWSIDPTPQRSADLLAAGAGNLARPLLGLTARASSLAYDAPGHLAIAGTTDGKIGVWQRRSMCRCGPATCSRPRLR
jgi:hypothetical protein